MSGQSILLLGRPGLWAVVPYTIFYWFYMVNRVRREEAKLAGIFVYYVLDNKRANLALARRKVSDVEGAMTM